MSDREKKIDLLLSLIRKAHGYLTIWEKDKSGNKVVISKKPIDGNGNIEFELIDSKFPLSKSEEEIQD